VSSVFNLTQPQNQSANSTAPLRVNHSFAFSNCNGPDNSSCIDLYNHSNSRNISGWYNISKNSSEHYGSHRPQGGACNGLCPAGYFCPEGTAYPISCPAGTYLPNSGSTYPGSCLCDCLMCPPGYVCSAGSSMPSPCPAGYYCPPPVEVNQQSVCMRNNSYGRYPKPEPCPAGTFQPLKGQIYADSCIVCGTWIWNISYLGQYCPIVGASEQTPCPEGHFCETGSPLSFPCAGGTYRQTSGGHGNLSCYICPASYFCPNATIHPISCPGGRFCRSGSAYATICPGGYFCPPNTSVPHPCPPGSFCKIGSWKTTACPVGTYCTGRLSIPTLCPLGTYGNSSEAINRSSIEAACINCPPGFYGNDPLRLGCSVCYAGYLCFGNSSLHSYGTTRGDPHDISVDGGQICPAGFFCEAGSYVPSPCPTGAFSPVPGSVDPGACVECPLNYFNNRTGQPACLPCGSTSYSTSDRTECKCKGGNRVFHESDSACRCAFGYAIYDSNGNPTNQGFSDGIADCDVRTLPRCSAGDLRGQDGSCIQSCDDSACQLPPCFCKLGTTIDYCNETCPSFQTPQAQKIQVYQDTLFEKNNF
jgi:hypothetical protein